MSDDKIQRGSPDRDRIDLSESYEGRDWTAKFGVSKEELRIAVSRVGDSAAAAARELGKPL